MQKYLGAAVVEDADDRDGHELVERASERLAAESEHERHVLLHGGLDDRVDGVVEAALGLYLLAVGRQYDAFELVEAQVLGDLAYAHDVAALGLGLLRILVVHAVLEAHDVVQQSHAHLVDVAIDDLVAVLAKLPVVDLLLHLLLELVQRQRQVTAVVRPCRRSGGGGGGGGGSGGSSSRREMLL